MAVAHGDGGEGAGGGGQKLLGGLQVPPGTKAVDTAGGVVVAQDHVALAGHRQWLEDQGAPRRHLLHLTEHGAFPAHHLGTEDHGKGWGGWWAPWEALGWVVGTKGR